ncbi:hypothetical protein BgiBS90_004585, partial [Biomphalaria glabrata]
SSESEKVVPNLIDIIHHKKLVKEAPIETFGTIKTSKQNSVPSPSVSTTLVYKENNSQVGQTSSDDLDNVTRIADSIKLLDKYLNDSNYEDSSTTTTSNVEEVKLAPKNKETISQTSALQETVEYTTELLTESAKMAVEATEQATVIERKEVEFTTLSSTSTLETGTSDIPVLNTPVLLEENVYIYNPPAHYLNSSELQDLFHFNFDSPDDDKLKHGLQTKKMDDLLELTPVTLDLSHIIDADVGNDTSHNDYLNDSIVTGALTSVNSNESVSDSSELENNFFLQQHNVSTNTSNVSESRVSENQNSSFSDAATLHDTVTTNQKNSEIPSTQQKPQDTLQEIPSTQHKPQDTLQEIHSTQQKPQDTLQEIPSTQQKPQDTLQEIPSTQQKPQDTLQEIHSTQQKPQDTLQEIPSTQQKPQDTLQEIHSTQQKPQDTLQEIPSTQQKPQDTLQEIHSTQQKPQDTLREIPLTQQKPHDTLQEIPSTQQKPQDTLQEIHSTQQKAQDTLQEIPSTQQKPQDTLQEIPSTQQKPQDTLQEIHSTQQKPQDTLQEIPSTQQKPQDTLQEIPSTQQKP